MYVMPMIFNLGQFHSHDVRVPQNRLKSFSMRSPQNTAKPLYLKERCVQPLAQSRGTMRRKWECNAPALWSALWLLPYLTCVGMEVHLHHNVPVCTLRERPLSGRLNNCVNFT